MTQNTNNDTNQDNTSKLSTAKTNISHTQRTSPRNYDPPLLPQQYSTHTIPHNSPQHGSYKWYNYTSSST